jgi:uncharacterized membrane protein YbhN (UPF0104 family)
MAYHVAAFIYYKLLHFTSEQKLAQKPVLELYIKSIPLRYIPGNFMHYAGRQILGAELNLKQSAIALSTILEIIFYCISCIFLSLLLGSKETIFLLSQYAVFDKKILIVLVVLFLLLLLLGFIFFNKIRTVIHKLKYLITKKFVVFIIIIISYNFLFFLAEGAMSFFLIRLYDDSVMNIFLVLFGFVIASFIGTVTPGAPGGIGSREAVLLIVLGPVCGESAVLQGAILQRFSLVVSDLLVFPVFKFLTGNIFKVKQVQQPCQ